MPTSCMKGILKIVQPLTIESTGENDVAYDWSISNTERNKKMHAYNGNPSSKKRITDFFGSKPENLKQKPQLQGLRVIYVVRFVNPYQDCRVMRDTTTFVLPQELQIAISNQCLM